MITLRRPLAGIALAALAGAVPAAANAQEFPQTLYWGSGLIDIPVAWVGPLNGDFSMNYSGKRFSPDPTKTKINYNDELNSQLTFSMSFLGRVEVGIAAFSSNPEQGFFARGLLLDERNFDGRPGAARFLPSVAIGARNIGPYGRIDRFGIGYDLIPPFSPTNDSPDAAHRADTVHRGFKTNGTYYGVATKTLSLSEIRSSFPDFNFSLTVGYGNGLFEDDGEIGENYSKHATGGLFYGASTDYAIAPNMTLTLLAENNAWDYNFGGNLNYRGIRAGLYFTEIGAGSADPDSSRFGSSIYNYSKVAFTLGWQSNIFALVRGNFLQTRAAELERARAGLLAEIERRRQRVAALELEINRYEAQNLLELEQRRAEATRALQEERDALRRIEERLRNIERSNPTPRPPQR